MFRWLRGIVDRLFVVAGAIALSQAPLYMQQYTQQLVGHTDELHYLVQKIEGAARESNKTLSEFLFKFSSSQDPDFALQGRMMEDIMERWQSFDKALDALQNASVASKPFVFIAHFHSDVAVATWSHFEYGLAFSLEGLVYILIGGAIGYSVFVLLTLPLKWIGRLFARKKVSTP